MKPNVPLLPAAAVLLSASLAGCGDDSSSTSGTGAASPVECASLADAGVCGPERYSETVFAEAEDGWFFCNGKAWVPAETAPAGSSAAASSASRSHKPTILELVVDVDSAFVGDTVRIEPKYVVDANGPEDVVAVEWDFGDGSGVLRRNDASAVFHVWRTVGDYEVSAKAIDSNGDSSVQTTIVRIANHPAEIDGLLYSDRGFFYRDDGETRFSPVAYVFVGDTIVFHVDSLRLSDPDGNLVDSLHWCLGDDFSMDTTTGLADFALSFDKPGFLKVSVAAVDSLGQGNELEKDFYVDVVNGSPSNNPCSNGFVTDSRDGRVYRCAEIGMQVWMTENLDFGTMVPLDSGHQGVSSADSARKWCYNDSLENCAKYGGLYQWHTAMGSSDSYDSKRLIRGICPEGWHVPTYREFNFLVQWDEKEQASNSGRRLSLASESGWADGGSGDNAWGFNALPAGIGVYDDSDEDDVWAAFGNIGEGAFFWSASDFLLWAYGYNITSSKATMTADFVPYENSLSVRCLQD